MTTPDLSYWNDALAGKRPAVHEDKPQCGYYRMRTARDGPFLPVVIFDREGERIAWVGASRTQRPAVEIWVSCAGKPVAKDAAIHAFNNANAWPTDAPPSAPAGIGDNSGGDLPLTEQIRNYAEQALSWLRAKGITNAATKDIAANMRQELLNLRKRADEQREAEKRPHDEAAKAVQAKFKPAIDEAAAAADEIRSALTVYMRAEEKRLQAEQAARQRAEEDRVRGEREKIAAEQAELMKRDPIAAMTSPPAEMPPMPEPEPEVRVQAGGQRGRRTGLRTVIKFEVADYSAVLAHVATHPDVRAVVERVACAQARAGAEVPGIAKRETKEAA